MWKILFLWHIFWKYPHREWTEYYLHLNNIKSNIGETLKIRTRTPIDERRNFKGPLLKTSETVVHIKVDNQEFEIPFESIDRARLVLELKVEKIKYEQRNTIRCRCSIQ